METVIGYTLIKEIPFLKFSVGPTFTFDSVLKMMCCDSSLIPEKIASLIDLDDKKYFKQIITPYKEGFDEEGKTDLYYLFKFVVENLMAMERRIGDNKELMPKLIRANQRIEELITKYNSIFE